MIPGYKFEWPRLLLGDRLIERLRCLHVLATVCVDWVLLKNSRKEVTVMLYSENGSNFLKMTPTALDSRVSVMQRAEGGGAGPEAREER